MDTATNEEKYKRIFNNLIDLFYQTDMKGTITEVSPSCEALTGWKREELIGKPVLEIYADPKQRQGLLEKILKDGRIYNYEVTLLNHSGISVPVTVSSHIVKDETGNPIYIEGTVRDVTEIKRLQEKLHELNQAIDSSDDAIYITKTDGIITYMNPGFMRMYGFMPEEVIGKVTPRILKSGLRKPEEYVNMWTNLLSKRVVQDEHINKAKDGALIVVHSTSSPITNDEGKLIGFLCIQQDITERKKTEKMLSDANKKNADLQKTKTEFISLASHQLKSPALAILDTASNFLKESSGTLSEPQKQSISSVIKDAEAMKELIDFLLKISRAETGTIKLELAPINLKETAENAIEILSNDLDNKNQTVSIVQTPDPFPFVFLDKDMTKQVMLILLSNANKYAPRDAAINISMVLNGETEVEFSIKDTGLGIPKEQQTKIFESFFRANNAITVYPEGTGLSLALVKSLVEAWGGKIWFESEENKGSTFHFTMPVLGPKAAFKSVAI